MKETTRLHFLMSLLASFYIAKQTVNSFRNYQSIFSNTIYNNVNILSRCARVSAALTPKCGIPSEASSSGLLQRVNSPKDLKALNDEELPHLCHELRYFLSKTLETIGGHFSGSLGVVELTVALHRIFDSPEDRIVWDIGHQAYIHKILTGRRDSLCTIRQSGGISGFCRIRESVHDQFGAGHSSTSISALQGLYEADRLLNRHIGKCYVCIIGDGGMTGGMAYEALNYASIIKSPLIIIYNDNEQDSLPTGLPAAHGTSAIIPFFMEKGTKMGFISAKEAIGSLNSDFSPLFIGPIDGHDLDVLQEVLGAIKTKFSGYDSSGTDRENTQRCNPVLLHVKTIKGKGCDTALKSLDRMHTIPAINQSKRTSKTFTDVFSESLIELGEKDPKVVAITAAMPGGTGVGKFGIKFPDRTFDVGIAEQHAVTFAAGLALGGAKPFCCIYSTFLQRAMDQIIHDVALQDLPVKFIIDRAGYVGNDGSSHHGNYDLAFLRTLHNLIIMAPSNELELKMMMKLAYSIDDRPCAIRFPKAPILNEEALKTYFRYTQQEIINMSTADEASMKNTIPKPEFLKARVIHRGTSGIAILGLGTVIPDAAMALKMLNIDGTLVDMRFLNPLDDEMIEYIAKTHDTVFTVEEGVSGGLGTLILERLSDSGNFGRNPPIVKSIRYPGEYIHHASQAEQRALAQIDATGIARQVESTIKKQAQNVV